MPRLPKVTGKTYYGLTLQIEPEYDSYSWRSGLTRRSEGESEEEAETPFDRDKL